MATPRSSRKKKLLFIIFLFFVSGFVASIIVAGMIGQLHSADPLWLFGCFLVSLIGAGVFAIATANAN